MNNVMRLIQPFRRLLLIAAVCALPGSVFATDPPGAPVSLNFANADIESVIDAIGKISGKNFVIDPRVKGTINIITHTPVAPELSYEILLSALRLQGYTAIEGDGVIKIVPEADAKLHGVPVGQNAQTQSQSLVTQVFPMRHESATQMLNVVRPLVSPNNTVTAFPSNNVLVVTDYADNLKRIAQIISSVDVPQGDVTVIELHYAIAVDLADTLTELMGNSNNNGTHTNGNTGNGEQIKKIQIIAEPRTNSLLVKSDNPALIRSARQLAASLDRPGAGGNIHVVYLRNAEAEKVAATLNAALSGEQTGNFGDSNTSNSLFSSSSSTTTSSSGVQDGRTITNLNSSNTDSNTFTSTNGIVKADKLNNALIIVAPDAVYRNIRHVIDLLDRRRAQVYIEALVAEITAERAAEIGIQWQVGGLLGGGSGALAGTNFAGGVGNAGNLLTNMAAPGSVNQGFNFLIGRGTVKIPDGAGGTIEVFNLGLLASFLEKDARNNILSTPNIVTLDNEEAKIMVGSEVPFPTGQYTNTGGNSNTVNPFQTIERKDVGLTLEVRPQISEGGTIKLDIYQETSSVANETAEVAKTIGRTTHKRSIRSSVLVDDGNIIALGGLVQDDYSAGESKVPLLGDLPFAGSLFRYNTRKRSKTNLVVFLRPVILRDDESYADLTNSRYDYVLGQQRLSKGRLTMPNEADPPELPPRIQEGEVVSDAPAPVREAVFIQIKE